jgi:hypothetical protein
MGLRTSSRWQKNLRQRTGLTEQALADRVGVAWPTIQKWEKRHRADASTAGGGGLDRRNHHVSRRFQDEVRAALGRPCRPPALSRSRQARRPEIAGIPGGLTPSCANLPLVKMERQWSEDRRGSRLRAPRPKKDASDTASPGTRLEP